MSIELKQAAQQALEVLESLQGGCTDSDDGTVEAITVWCPEVIEALSTSIQQAESEPVAVRNPFASRCYTMSESHLSGHRLIVGFEKLEDAQSAHEWVARCGRSNPGELPGMWHESDLIGGETDCEPSRPPHPAPGVPDAAIDSAIYNQCPDFDDWHEGPSIDDIRAIVHTAMLTVAQAQKG